MLTGTLGIGVFLAGCQGKKNRNAAGKVQDEPSRESSPDSVTKEKQTYRFVDVYGESYEAELLVNLTPCSYDYDRLKWKNGFPFYVDENGEVISRLGVDVSKYQGDVDWKKVKETGIDFTILRLGFRGYGEAGKLAVDEYFEKNIKGALDAGLEVGVYFFSQAVSCEEAEEEAAFVLDHIKDYSVTGPVIFDTEEIKDDTARTDCLTKEQFTDHCIAFCSEIEKAGYRPMIYANMKWMAFTLELERLEDYEKWYADYEAVPQNPYAFTIWQYTEKGKIPGIEGSVDLNIWFQ